MELLLFGTGDYYNRYKKWFKHHKVLALLDNSIQKQHTIIDGIVVLSPEEGVKLHYDRIVILSFYVKQMKQQLISLGVDEEKIYHFYNLHQLLDNKEHMPIQYFLNAGEIIKSGENSSFKVLLMSTDLVLGGPSIALFHAAIILKNYGYKVVYVSMWDGPLRELLTQCDIPVVVDENLPVSTMKQTEWVNAFSLIICNTLNFHIFLSERDTTIPVIWWLHDARFFYDGVNKETIRKIEFDNLKVVSVGPVPTDAIKEFLPNIDCEELLYGVQEADNSPNYIDIRESNKKVQFITIGFLEDIKGHDILLQAIKKLTDDIRHKCRFYIVGHDKTLFGEKIHEESADIEEIVFTGKVSRKEIHELLANSDALICPSRQDSMPTVVAEAMMHAVPCIVSNVIGTASYIQDNKSGFVFESENSTALAEKIKWCVLNKSELEIVGNKARRLYENYFSMEAFEKQFLRIVQEVLG